ncbi:hypothetical protein ACFSAV_02995 [Pasteurella oralis]|uniref:Uncharacterized protein n=1 Tax=Pasteurella oralis TaxID=1071947 RepID=A0ABW4NW80_9PAST
MFNFKVVNFFCVLILFYYLFWGMSWNEYSYFNQLVSKNSKPFFISQAEFVKKNKDGYCWRDRKYYSLDELKDKAMVQLSSILLYEIYSARNEKLVKDGGEIEKESAYFCKKNKEVCSLWFVAGDYTNEKLKKYLLNHFPLSPINKEVLEAFYANEVITPEYLEDYISNGNQYALFGNSFLNNYMLGSDCCAVIKDKPPEFKNYRLITGESNFSKRGNIPEKVDIKAYGIGIYYFYLDYFYYFVSESFEGGKHHYVREFNDIKDVYFLSNCGDILFKPYYSN